ncbi:ATP-dependent Clp protease ATP-binding subunit [Crassaminicella thermophila]|uniref:ATP-dependent Clp protease ATP-binding subunit n=1 Tax=Crassaminicella thermophila TaxID=2599308 RepID=A0A5C0SHY5_CRATE|nr:ATP-dependent Clp protease ATP-binding subunit [Crassaminicella thermophila]QEK12818.1 ATP-dependent Clp protease ATP-binding subunit [Crassaminicella thermophila]
MKLCSVCKKNMAIVFTSIIEKGKTEIKGLCIECAKKMGIPVIDQLMKQAGMNEEDIENLTEQMKDMFQDMDMEDLDDDNNMFMNLFNSSFPSMKDVDDEDFEIKDKKDFSQEKGKQDMKEKKKKAKKKKKYLEMYGINLTEKAKNNEVDKIIGRHREIDRVVQILNRRTKNNPILIGEPGVGKTAIAEGLAVRIVEREVPAKLFNSEIYLLDLTAVVAGTQFRGQFEGRMKSIIKEATECGNVILVIDEVHNIMGAGEVHGGVMNAANILKPALARGEIQVIGATTLEEYRKHIEKDSALERRFQPVLVEEPTIEETIEILKGIKNYYEDYHKVKISDEVIEAAANLSERYITDRFLPDKAIDVIDEAGSRANLKNQGLVELEALKEELKKIKEEKEAAAVHNDFEKAAQYKMQEFKIEEKINEIEKKSSHVQITVEDIAYVIESWTKIPVQKIAEEEAKKLLNLEERLHKRVIGQHEAIVSLARTIRRNRSGFRKKKKPASFIFVGPTGVGKTELVKTLAYELFGSEDAMIRMDMSEYMEKHTVSKLIGAPPGYVGYDQGGQLTEKVRRKPYSVILLDEIEKAHPDVFNMLLQILEDGRLTDNQGRTTFFENTVIIMTSNIGTNGKSKGIGFENDGYTALENRVKDALKETFRPEFLNRIDETIVFTYLSKEELRQIVDLMLKEVMDEAKEKNISIEVSEEVKDFILEKGYDEKYGARPLRRTIQKYIEDEIAEQYLKNKFREGSHIKIVLKDGKIILQ